MINPVFVVPTPTTLTSLVASVLCGASRMCIFAVSVSRYLVKVSSFCSSSSHADLGYGNAVELADAKLALFVPAKLP
jgi:hypothetical protein